MRVPILLAAILLAGTACSAHPTVAASSDVDAEVVLLPDPDGGVADWTGWAGMFVQDYCVQCHNPAAPCSASGCHPSNGVLPDFRLRATVVSFAPSIRCGVAVKQDPSWDCGAVVPEQFPVEQGGNPLPTDDQRALLVGWIEAGCP